jgi:hypothetical protein
MSQGIQLNTANRTLETILTQSNNEIASIDPNMNNNVLVSSGSSTLVTNPTQQASTSNTNAATFSSSTPYIIQNGKIYQLTSNNQLIARNLIQINQIPSLVNNAEANSGQKQTTNEVVEMVSSPQINTVTNNGSLIINGKPATIKTNPILNLNTSNGRIILKAPENQPQQGAVKSINIIPSNINIKPTTALLSKAPQTVKAGLSNSLQQKLFPVVKNPGTETTTGIKNNTIIISNNRLQSLLSGQTANQDGNLQMIVQQPHQSNLINSSQNSTANTNTIVDNVSLNETGKICDLTKEINLNKSDDNLINLMNNGQQIQFKVEQNNQQFEMGNTLMLQNQLNQSGEKGRVYLELMKKFFRLEIIFTKQKRSPG